MSHPEPYTLLGEVPTSSDWEFLVPRSVSDENLSHPSIILGTSSDRTTTPIIVGFIQLVKVFLCMRNLLSKNSTMQPKEELITKSSLLATFSALSAVLDDIPSQLDILQLQPYNDQQTTTITNHVNIMTSNIYITRLYLQCWILDRYLCLLPLEAPAQSPSSTLSEAQRIREYRQDITRQALRVLKFCSQSTLESHGESMVIKIREIATSLLEQEQQQLGNSIEESFDNGCDSSEPGIGSVESVDGQEHVMASFLHILAALDYAHRQSADAT